MPACSTVGMVVLLSSSASLIIRSADEDDDDDEEWKKDEGVELWHDVNAWHDFAAENAKEGECLARRTANVVDKGRICIIVAGRLLRLWINGYLPSPGTYSVQRTCRTVATSTAVHVM